MNERDAEDAYFQDSGGEEDLTVSKSEPGDDDPFAAFMANIKQIVKKQETGAPEAEKPAIRLELEDQDQEVKMSSKKEELMKWEQEGDIFDERGNVDFRKVKELKKRGIPALRAINHAEIEHEAVQKDFYQPDETILAMSTEEIEALKRKLGIRTRGEQVPAPIEHFQQLQGLDAIITARMRKERYERPTPIQAQSIPCGLLGRDVIGVAKTGSGKTLAFMIPLLTHVLDQRILEKGEGPVGVVLAPTRELAFQIQTYFQKFCKRMGVRVLCLVGGQGKYQQWKILRQGVEVVVSTPGTMIQMLRKRALNLWSRCSFVVIDEADEMFKMGFEYQVRSILGQIRPDRQTLLFSATFRQKVERFCEDLLWDPIKINVGSSGVANSDVTQKVLIFDQVEEKAKWLANQVPRLAKNGQVLIFVNQIKDVQEVSEMLQPRFATQPEILESLHGDLVSTERLLAIEKFKNPKQPCKILIATNVASRGLDIPAIRTVISYSPPRDENDHIHRVGRTGRAGNTEGTAYTLLMRRDKKAAGMLVRNLEKAGQAVGRDLESLAMKDSKFHQSRITIGIKGFSMKINLHKQQKRVQAQIEENRGHGQASW